MKKLDQIIFNDPIHLQKWNNFLQNRPVHHIANIGELGLLWEKLYGFKNYTYYLNQNNDNQSAFSLFRIKSPIIGDMLVTCPFFGYGGFLPFSKPDVPGLVNEIIRLTDNLPVDFVEIRTDFEIGEPFKVNQSFSEYKLNLEIGESDLWEKSLTSNVRQNIRKSQKQGFQFKIHDDPIAGYEFLNKTMRNHGTPFHNWSFFDLLMKYLPGQVSFAAVEQNDGIVAGGLLLCNQDILYTPYIGSLEPYRQSGANYFLYWNIIQESIRQGISVFDFGRSPNDSTHAQFKLKCGCEKIPVFYNYLIVNPKYKYKSVSDPTQLQMFATKVWQHLPLWLTKKFGHYLFRHIP